MYLYSESFAIIFLILIIVCYNNLNIWVKLPLRPALYLIFTLWASRCTVRCYLVRFKYMYEEIHEQERYGSGIFFFFVRKKKKANRKPNTPVTHYIPYVCRRESTDCITRTWLNVPFFWKNYSKNLRMADFPFQSKKLNEVKRFIIHLVFMLRLE